MRSAYLICFRDDDFLDVAIRSVIDLVDEIVVVDGAYSWMSPYLRPLGIPPEHSGDSVVRILRPYGATIRYFTGIWDDEVDKRAFGFAQCRGDVVVRIDADEHLEVAPNELQEFSASPYAVAAVPMPLMADGRLQWWDSTLGSTPTQSIFFRRDAFDDPRDHCAHLWLVLGTERESINDPDHSLVRPDTMGRLMHLSNFRTGAGALTRARFYLLRWMLNTHMAPWEYLLPAVPDPAALSDIDFLARALSVFPTGGFERWLEGTDLCSGFGIWDGATLANAGVSTGQAELSEKACERWRESRRALLDFHRAPRPLFNGVPSRIDATSMVRPDSRSLWFTLSTPPESVSVTVRTITMREGEAVHEVECDGVIDGHTVTCDLRSLRSSDNARVVFTVVARGCADSRASITGVGVS